MSVGVVPRVDVFLMYLWGGRWSPRLTPPPSWRFQLPKFDEKLYTKPNKVKEIHTCISYSKIVKKQRQNLESSKRKKVHHIQVMSHQNNGGQKAVVRKCSKCWLLTKLHCLLKMNEKLKYFQVNKNGENSSLADLQYKKYSPSGWNGRKNWTEIITHTKK